MSFIGNGGSNNLFSELPRVTPCNSLANTVQRMGGYCVEVEGARITGTGIVNIPVFKVNGKVGLLEQFKIGQTHGVDTFVRFNFTTTDSPVDFKSNIYFTWEPINGGYLELV